MTPQPPDKPDGAPKKRSRVEARIGFVMVLLVMGITGTILLGKNWPALGANLANPLRSVLGNQGVANLEAFLFTLQDRFNQWEYRSGRKQAAAPWQAEGNQAPTPAPATPVPSPASARERAESSHPAQGTETAVASSNEPEPLATETAAGLRNLPGPTLVDEPTTTPKPVPTEWVLEAVAPFGKMEGEGVWIPYIRDAFSQTVAMRTFLQPDPDRPYAYVAVVALDLTAVRLNFVIGFDEPSEKGGPKGDGVIPEEDFQADVLLAAFNGGFQSTHGLYGAMANGFEPLPAQDEAATVTMHRDGTVRIGAWGQDLQLSDDMVAFRQNCPMVVHNGQINPQVYNNSTVDWGGTVENQIATWRSGLGISADGNVLYYFVGPSLSMPVLADAMLAAGAHNSMLLDINAFWVHFVAIRNEDGVFLSEPLLPDAMQHKADRYLQPFPRDFFYITRRGRE